MTLFDQSLLEMVISGGQTGVDRAALDAGIAAGIPVGGWCPRGRLAEDGVIPLKYPLKETDTSEYAVRTRLNVRDSDGTLIIYSQILSGGTAVTVDFARELQRPHLLIDLSRPGCPAQAIADWLVREQIRTLNVAGPRESGFPGVYTRAFQLLNSLFELTSVRAG